MDTHRIQNLTTYLAFHFAIIACLTSALFATDENGNLFLPTLVFLVTVSSLILVDGLKVFYIGRVGSYVGMGIATLIALVTLGLSMMRRSEEGQFMAVASLLIYPQCVLFFQKKSLRVFEQLAIFLLLQMIVAALINDNLIYGIMLTPIVMLWVSSLYLVSRYATLVDVSPTIEDPVPLLYELIYQKFMKTVNRSAQTNPIVEVHPEVDPRSLVSQKRGGLLLSMPLAICSLSFAGMLYYLLPRTESVALLGIQYGVVGLPDAITTGYFGSVLTDPTPVMRLKMTDASGTPYQPVNPPYLRVRVLDRYGPPAKFYEAGVWLSGIPNQPRSFVDRLDSIEGRDAVTVDVSLKKDFRRSVVSLPPVTRMPDYMAYKSNDMTLMESDDNRQNRKRKILAYQFNTLAFADRLQIPIVPEPRRSLGFNAYYTNMPPLPVADQKRKEILHSSQVQEENQYAVAKALEYHLKSSGEYRYSLNLPRPINEDIDPIEDFLVNLKVGLCQNYAAALVTMLRQSEIPSRIVIGYVPVEWNKFGQHFIVKQSDAHAWVEARFSRSDLIGTDLEPWLTNAEYYWVQLDPTPSSDDVARSIVESSQSFEYAEKLWEDYVSNADKIKQSGLYEGVTGSGWDIVGRLRDELRMVGENMSEGWFRGNDIHFAWPLALAVIGIGSSLVVFWQIARWLPQFAPELAQRLGLARRLRTRVEQPYFARSLELLESARIYRHSSETMQEYNDRACEEIALKSSFGGALELSDSLNFLRRWYYYQRFGYVKSLTPETKRLLDHHLTIVEKVLQNARNPKG